MERDVAILRWKIEELFVLEVEAGLSYSVLLMLAARLRPLESTILFLSVG
jgi:hypothetical protein